MLPIQIKIIPPCQHARPQKPLKAVKGIVLHYTGDEGASDTAIRNYFANDSDGRYASAHFAVDDDSITQCLPEREMAYHVGSPNPYKQAALDRLSTYPNNCTIGIEMCINKAGAITPATRQNTIDLTVYLLKKYGLTAANLWRHFDITGKDCPSPWVQNPSEWERFKKDVAAAMAGTPKPVQKQNQTCIVRLNGKVLPRGIMQGDKAYVPIRAFMEAAGRGKEVGWSDASQKATIAGHVLDTTLIFGSTGYAHARELAQVSGFSISWDGKTQTVDFKGGN